MSEELLYWGLNLYYNLILNQFIDDIYVVMPTLQWKRSKNENKDQFIELNQQLENFKTKNMKYIDKLNDQN